MLNFTCQADYVRHARRVWEAHLRLKALESSFHESLTAFQKKLVLSWRDWRWDDGSDGSDDPFHCGDGCLHAADVCPGSFCPESWPLQGHANLARFQLRCWGDPENRRWLAGAAGKNSLRLVYVLALQAGITKMTIFVWRQKKLLESLPEDLKGASVETWSERSPRLVIPVRSVPLEDLADASSDWLSVMAEPLTEALGTVRKLGEAMESLVRDLADLPAGREKDAAGVPGSSSAV